MLGRILDGRYQVTQILSAGGFGETYIAEDTRRPSKPKCVVKHLKPTSNDPNYLQIARRLFNTEAEILEKLGDHNQIPRLLAYFEDNQEFYLVQEFILGHPLSSELPANQKWSENEAIQFLEDILGILKFVHSNGVIHRDIKPDNMIRRQQDSKLVLIDFGAVKQVRTQLSTVQNSIISTISIGTPGYMPAEQGQGKPRLNSDIYAVGIVAIQALTGLYPTQMQEDPNTGEIVWHQHTQVSLELAAILNKMVRYYYRDRYQSVTEVLQALEKLANRYPPQQFISHSQYTSSSYAAQSPIQPSINYPPQTHFLTDDIKKNLVFGIKAFLALFILSRLNVALNFIISLINKGQLNYAFNIGAIQGIMIIIAGLFWFLLSTSSVRLNRIHDSIFAALSVFYGSVLLSEGWWLEPILLLNQVMMLWAAIFSVTECIRLRQIK